MKKPRLLSALFWLFGAVLWAFQAFDPEPSRLLWVMACLAMILGMIKYALQDFLDYMEGE